MARRDPVLPIPTPDDGPPLGFHEEDPIWGAVLRVTGLGDGLSKLAAVDPVAMRRGERGVLVVEYTVREIGYPPGEGPFKQPGVNRLHVLNAGLVTIVDPKVVAKALNEQQKRIDAASAQQSLLAAARKEQAAVESAGDEDEYEPPDNVRDMFNGPEDEDGE